jgi:poly-D-alanine transfer protein DltD
MKLNHLAAACAALGLAAILLLTGSIYARWLEKRTVHSVATEVSDQMTIGEAFLQEAVRQPDLLVVVGSSELLAENGANQANHFFQTYPTGFNTYIFAREGMTSLNMAQVSLRQGPSCATRRSSSPLRRRCSRPKQHWIGPIRPTSHSCMPRSWYSTTG